MSDEIQRSNKAAGGFARAAKMTPEQRSEVARKAAKARWEPETLAATYSGVIKIGEVVEIPCAVLEDGRRVLTQSGVMRALGRARQAKGRQYYDGDVNLPAFLTAKNLKPFITKDLEVTSSQIEFRLNGKRAYGYEAGLLPRVCDVFVAASEAGVLAHNQEHIAKQALILMRGLAHVGINALIDEATGYQDVRDRQALQVILEKYLTDEWAKWTKTFPDEFYKHLFRLKGLPYPSLGNKRPQYVGHWTNNIVYSRLAPGVKKALQKKNPRRPKGGRLRKHHQFLTRDYGHPELREHLNNVIFLMRSCDDWDDFEMRLDKAAAKYGDTIPIPFTSSAKGDGG